MQNKQSVPSSQSKTLWSLIFKLLNSDVFTLVLEGWHLLRKIINEREVSLYEVLNFEHILELCDPHGKEAIYHKRETVRLLQDNVVAYTDQAWGKGKIFGKYQCSPGVPVDRYRDGYKWRVLISLRETKQRGDVLRISIKRTVYDGFDVKEGWSETEVSHRTMRFRIGVIFPQQRPCRRASLVEKNRNRVTSLGEPNQQTLPDGRCLVFWETNKPVLFETYSIKWAW